MKRNKATKKKNKKTLKKVCQLKKSFYIYSIKQETKKIEIMSLTVFYFALIVLVGVVVIEVARALDEQGKL